jgi:patatin-like phospholipase/acyl hydrolase
LKKILTIDGGGIRGVFPAAFLADLEKNLKQPIGRYFDLIAGTSTGGIIAIALALGMKASEILNLYEENGPKIFAQTRDGILGWLTNRCHAIKWCISTSKYKAKALSDALHEVFGEKLIGDAQTRLLIPAWHSKTQSVYIFKTAHHPRLQKDQYEFAVDVAMETAAAPTYFPQHISENGMGFLDGGIWANNPTGIAVVEAIGVLGWPAKDLKILSIGCLDDISTIETARGAIRLAFDQARLFMTGQTHASLGIAQILTGDPHEQKSIYRISQPVPKGLYTLDNTRKINELKDRALAESRKQGPILQSVFFTEPAEQFTPMRTSNND